MNTKGEEIISFSRNEKQTYINTSNENVYVSTDEINWKKIKKDKLMKKQLNIKLLLEEEVKELRKENELLKWTLIEFKGIINNVLNEFKTESK